MSQPARLRYAGNVEVEPTTGDLLCEGVPVPLRAQTVQLLQLLIRHRSRVVARDEIRAVLWGDGIGDHDEGINACMRELRRALGDSAADVVFIETVPKRGYRWIAVEQDAAPVSSTADAGARRPWRRWMPVAAVAAAAIVGTVALGARFATGATRGLIVVVSQANAGPAVAPDSMVQALRVRLHARGVAFDVEAASATSVLEVERARLHRGGEARSVTFVLELPAAGADGVTYLFRAADRATLWTGAAESRSLADSIATVIAAMQR